jgi:hypothetical protein
MICPVCFKSPSTRFTTVDDIQYWRCKRCDARFMGSEYLPAKEQEYAHYQHHENDVDDPRYRKFLQKTAAPLLAKLAKNSTLQNGLDYGCGPGPAMAAVISEAGHNVSLYDPFFHNDLTALNGTYDFITCTETAEHFHQPGQEFERLNAMLKPGGWLGLMTCFQTDDFKFATWHYRRDPTHVVFYRMATLSWLANHYNWSCEFPVKDVALMQKSR